MPKGKRICAQLKTVLLKVYDYFSMLEQRGGARGALRRTSEATGEQTLYCFSERRCLTLQHNNIGISESTLVRLRRERTVSGADFSSPAKWYKMSRRRIVVDDFDREAIQRCIYQVYEDKEHLTLSKLLVRSSCSVVIDVCNLLLPII